MNEELTIINRVLLTLDHIKVEGKQNLNLLLGSIQELERLKEMLATKEVK